MLLGVVKVRKDLVSVSIFLGCKAAFHIHHSSKICNSAPLPVFLLSAGEVFAYHYLDIFICMYVSLPLLIAALVLFFLPNTLENGTRLALGVRQE